MKYIFLIVSLFFFNFFLFSCSEKISNEEIIEMVKLDLQNCPAPSGKTDLWFKHYGIGDVERANIVVSAGGYIQLSENKVPYVVWPSDQTMYDWLITEAGGELIWNVTEIKNQSTVSSNNQYWLGEAAGGPNLVHDPSGIIAGSQNVVLPLPMSLVKDRKKPVKRANLYPPVKVFKDSKKSDYKCNLKLDYPK